MGNGFEGDMLQVVETSIHIASLIRRVWIAAPVFLLLAVGSAAQDTVTGAFQGDVSDFQTSRPVSQAVIKITSVERGTVYDLTADSQGRFFQGLLEPGFYDILVSGPNYQPKLLRREVRVSLTGDIIPVPVALEPVSPGAAPQLPPANPDPPDDVRVEIITTDARQESSYREDSLTRPPLGGTTITRSFDELALISPGVAPPPETIGDVAGPGVGPGVGSAGQFAVNGIRSRANNFTVDGSDNNDEDIGVRRQGFVALVPQPIESIKEFQIQTLLAPAQFGRNIGAQVNAVSKAGGNRRNGTLYGSFNSDKLNARNFFDRDNVRDSFALTSESGQAVLLDGQPLMVRNGSAGENSFTFGQAGAILGGVIEKNRLFYFVSGEYQKINAVQEKSFSVPNVEERGPFRTGATGIFESLPFDSRPLTRPAIPSNPQSAAIFSLYPFANDPDGVYGVNTFTQVLPAGGRGAIISGRIDHTFSLANGRPQSITGRYNFTDDAKDIPAVNEAIFSSINAKVRTQNLSLFYNSQPGLSVFNQVRFSFGRTRLGFAEIRDGEFLMPSQLISGVPFLLNAPLKFNITQAAAVGQAHSGPVLYSNAFDPIPGGRQSTVEQILGPLGQVHIAGFSPVGTDVYNFPQDRVNNTYQLADEITLRSGSHSLVFGADIRQTGLTSDLPRLSRPSISFNGSPRLILENGVLRLPTPSDPFPVLMPQDLVGLGTASNSLLTFNIDGPDARNSLRFYQGNFYAQDTWRVSQKLSLAYGLRYEYNTPVREVNALIEQTFADPRLTLAPGLDRFIAGRSRLYDPDKNNFAPRVGLAYAANIFGSNRVSVFRVGYGTFYDQILGAVVSQSRNVFPTYLTVNYGGVSSSITDVGLEIRNPGRDNAGIGLPIQLPGTVNQLNPAVGLANYIQRLRATFPGSITTTLPARGLRMPMAHHYSITFEQQLNANFIASAGYVGTAGRNLLRFASPNLGPSLTVAPTVLDTVPFTVRTGTAIANVNIPTSQGRIFVPGRAEPGIGAVTLFETTARSSFNSLQATLRGRFINSLDFQASYTFSKAMDEVSDVFDLSGAFALPQNSLTLAGERADANFDVRHRLGYSLTYDLSGVSDGRKLGWLINGLQIATTGRMRTGQPFTVNSVIDVNLDGNLTDRPDSTRGIVITGDRSRPLRLDTTNTAALLAPFGQDGRIKRNSFRAGNVVEMDLSLTKKVSFASQTAVFRIDVFNIIDRANFGVPVRLLEAPGFGQAIRTITPGRRIQFSLKYEF